MREPLRVGLIGYGYWGPILLRNFHAHAGFVVTWVCDRNEPKRLQARSMVGTIQLTDDPENLFVDPQIDVIVIATQADSHYALARSALLANKHLWVEKPLTTTVAKAQELISLAKERGLVLLTDHTYLYSGQYHKVREIINQSQLGRLLHIHSTRANFGLFPVDTNIVWNLFYHDAYILLDLLGDRGEVEIKASAESHIVPGKVDTLSVSLRFGDGVTVNVVNNMLFPDKVRRIILSGDEKIMLWDEQSPQPLLVYEHRAEFKPEINRVEHHRSSKGKPVAFVSGETVANAVDYFYEQLCSDSVSDKSSGRDALEIIGFLQCVEQALQSEGIIYRHG